MRLGLLNDVISNVTAYQNNMWKDVLIPSESMPATSSVWKSCCIDSLKARLM